jgi:microsomal dipeptidase-like Zn-dependent dipeptidase
MPNVAREMVRRGYTDTEIRKVLGLNLMRVYSKVWGK